ncbi:fungal-specific transcription factor domain-containing protein [Lactarius hatsudake]|nr:fungal-specific transcription factor domain-containing protein [Lactarius hatsudake]
MPVDLSKPQLDRRKVSRDAAAGLRQDGMYSREIEMKRNRGELSCAECRRLKIKCDKQIPCQACQVCTQLGPPPPRIPVGIPRRIDASFQRRGCASLCPNGSLATGQGTRFVIAATEHLHRRIGRMGDRIRELEDALAVLQGSHSSEPHPLLCEDSLVGTDKPDEQPQASEDEGADEVTRSLGTLTVSDHGTTRFFGSTGGSLLLLNVGSAGSPSQTTESDSSKSLLPLHLQRFTYSFPFTPTGTDQQTIDTIKDYLPPWDRALAMAESYLANATWIYRSVTQQQLINEMLPAIYGTQTTYTDDYSGPHDLALLFSVFALGSVMDTSLPNSTSDSEGAHYNHLALVALCQQPVFLKPSVATIQTLHLSALYGTMHGGDVNGGEINLESTWSLVAVACYLAQTIGLDRDPARWESDPRIVQRRRLVFWDLFLVDSWHALTLGRPPSFNRAFIDCEFPQEGDVPKNLDPGDASSLRAWMFRFGFEGPAEIVARTLTAAPPRYSVIQELDLKVHQFRVTPETLQVIRGGPGVDPRSVPIPAFMIAFMLSNTQDVLLMYLHRNFFIQALIENPENPIRGQYGPSFLATVQASKNILRTIEEQLPIQPVIVSRFSSIWTFTFSAAVVFAFIATHGPRSPEANDAIIELDRAYSLTEFASKCNRRAKRALVILNRMREKAHRALEAVRNSPPPPQPDGAVRSVKEEEIDDDFVVFAGRRDVFRQGGNLTPAPQAVPTQHQDHTQQQDQAQQQDQGAPPDEHGAHGAAGESMFSGWLAHQEQPVGYDPHHVTAIDPPPSAPYDPHQHQQHQHHQYGYAPEQPQYTFEAAPPPPHYMTAPHAYAPPHNLHPSSHASGIGQPLHGPPTDEQADMRRDYAVIRAPPPELAQLGFAAHGSRLSEAWMSFMQ